MTPIEEMEYHPLAEQLVTVLTKKTQSTDKLFYRVLVAYYFAKAASMMRCNIETHDRGVIPVNLYALNLAPSGTGKGLSTNIMEDQVLAPFKEVFLNQTFPTVAEENLYKIAVKRAKKKGVDPEEELVQVKKEFLGLGPYVFSFDSGTAAAIKQMRHKLLMANTGSMNFEMDEVGANFSTNTEVLNSFIELYDVGKIKQKLTKNTAENKRNESIDGRTPTNMLLFGTPAKLLDGGRTEHEFFQMLEMGYARRLLFGYIEKSKKPTDLTPEELYDMLTDKTSELTITTTAKKLEKLAGLPYYNTVLTMSKDVSLELLAYQLHCTRQAEELKEHEEVKKSELTHRYYKALKLAGAYAFIDESPEITMQHLHNAIKLVETSGEAFNRILTREKPYVKLAKYIAEVGKEVTQVDLVEDLPFYKGSESARREMMDMAVIWGYKHNIIIKKSYIDGIEFLRGESLNETDLSKIRFSWSNDITVGYQPMEASWDDLWELTQTEGIHYTAHWFKDGHRKTENLIPGFNLVIVDVDGTISLETAKLLLRDYKCLFATTKRHTEKNNRFRIIFPLSHTLVLEPKEYSQFMENVFEWLPFEVDIACKDPARKWLSHPGTYHYNDGELLDAMLFIPQTKKSKEFKEKNASIGSLTHLERWFLNNTGEGNRSNMMIRYALALADSGYTLEQVRTAVMSFNAKLPQGLDEEEISSTIMITVAKHLAKIEAQELDQTEEAA